MGKQFIKPEKPFMVSDHFESEEREVRVNWFESEEDAVEYIQGYMESFPGEYVVDEFIEIGALREIEMN